MPYYPFAQQVSTSNKSTTIHLFPRTSRKRVSMNSSFPPCFCHSSYRLRGCPERHPRSREHECIAPMMLMSGQVNRTLRWEWPSRPISLGLRVLTSRLSAYGGPTRWDQFGTWIIARRARSASEVVQPGEFRSSGDTVAKLSCRDAPIVGEQFENCGKLKEQAISYARLHWTAVH
jgi:hypothetical protein